jgi:hypothetical protein
MGYSNSGDMIRIGSMRTPGKKLFQELASNRFVRGTPDEAWQGA